MSGKRRRSEIIWDDNEEKARSSEFHSNASPGRSHNWSKPEAHDDLMHGNFSRSPSWEGNRNGPNNADIRRDRNRMYSHPTHDGWEQQQHSTHPSDDGYGPPYRSRDKGIGNNVQMSRDRARERSRSLNKSRSRSRDRVGRSSRESSRGYRHETNASYSNMRNNNNKGFDTRGGGNNATENWSRRTDYKDSSRYNDYPHRNSRIPCRYFAAGNCNRDNCRFSHDVPEAPKGYDDNRNLGKRNRTWNDDQHPRDDLNASGFHGVGKSYANLDNKKRSWDGPTSWDDVKSGGFDEASRLSHTLDENNTTWDSRDDRHVSRNASGFHDVGKSDPNLDNKKPSWDGPTSWDDMNSGGFDETSRRGHTLDENNTWDSRDDNKKLFHGHASGFHDVGKSHPNLDNKISSWDGVSGSGFSSVSNPFQKHEDSSKAFLNDNNAKGRISEKIVSNVDGNKTKKWDGPLWDEVSEPVTNDKKWAGPGLNNMVPEDANQHQQVVTSGTTNLIQNVDNMSHSYLNGPEQSHMPFDGPLNTHIQGAYVHMENQNKGEMDVSQPQAVNNLNETSLTSQQAVENQSHTETSNKEPQLPQLYTDLHLTDAIDYLKSLPNSAYNQDSRAKESVTTGMLSGSETQQKHDSKAGQTGIMEKKIVEGFEKKRVGKKEDKLEEGDDEKAMRQFKVGLVDLVKDILKPKWKEGKMSREVHKNVVKKVVEKVTTTIQIPKTQPKIEQYLAYSKPKITKLVEAYLERLLKA